MGWATLVRGTGWVAWVLWWSWLSGLCGRRWAWLARLEHATKQLNSCISGNILLISSNRRQKNTIFSLATADQVLTEQDEMAEAAFCSLRRHHRHGSGS